MLGGLVLLAAACGGSGPAAAPTTSSTASTTTPAGAAAGASTTTTAPGTEQLALNPFTSAGIRPGIKVALRTTGTCGAQSALDPGRGGAYVCTLDHAEPNGAKSADPCFYDAFGTQSSPLLCFSSPVDLSVVEVVPDNLLPSPNSPAGEPWAVRLDNGQVCTYLGAAAGSGASASETALDYRCPHGGIRGGPDMSSSFWTVAYLPSGATTTETVKVDAAYT